MSTLSLPISFCPAGYPVYDAGYGMGTGPIFLDDVDCSGDEERLIDCEHNGISVHNCRHYQDAGVYCSPSIYLTTHTSYGILCFKLRFALAFLG